MHVKSSSAGNHLNLPPEQPCPTPYDSMGAVLLFNAILQRNYSPAPHRRPSLDMNLCTPSHLCRLKSQSRFLFVSSYSRSRAQSILVV